MAEKKPRVDPTEKRTAAGNGLAAVLIAVAGLLIYGNIYEAPFVFDDLLQIVNKSAIKDLGRFLGSGEILSPRGIVDLTFALNYHFGGLEVFGYHLVNVLIHVLNGIVVYFLGITVFSRLLETEARPPATRAETAAPAGFGKPGSGVRWMALVAALVFVAHPVQTQAVTYTVQRYASMAALFYMASVLFYLRGRIKAKGRGFPSWAFYGLAILCALLAFMSKQNTASLPGAILLVEYLAVDRTWQGWKRKLLWMVPAAVLFLGLFLVLSGGVRFGRLLEDVSGLAQETDSVGRWSYLITQFRVMLVYIRLLVFPAGQNFDPFYPFQDGFFEGWTPYAFLFLAALAGAGVWQVKRRPVIALGIFWFFIALSVESSVIPIRDAMFEHRLYLPKFGFAAVVSYGLFKIFSGRTSGALAVSAAIVLALGIASYSRNEAYKEGVTLWADAADKNPRNWRAHYNLGNALRREERYADAAEEFSRALELKPDHVSSLYNLGLALERQGKIEEAVSRYEKALQIGPPTARIHMNAGAALGSLGRLDAAINHFLAAVKLDPDAAEAHYNLGFAYSRKGEFDKAAGHYKKALEIQPDHAPAHMNLAVVLAREGNVPEAIRHLTEAVRIRPEDPRPRRILRALTQEMSKSRMRGTRPPFK